MAKENHKACTCRDDNPRICPVHSKVHIPKSGPYALDNWFGRQQEELYQKFQKGTLGKQTMSNIDIAICKEVNKTQPLSLIHFIPTE